MCFKIQYIDLKFNLRLLMVLKREFIMVPKRNDIVVGRQGSTRRSTGSVRRQEP